MANKDHVEKLRGLDAWAWNAWKEKNVKADLRGATLCGADLANRNLRFADLSDANLSGAILAGADLTNAKLQDACLGEASLLRANLFGAQLDRATLDGSVARYANFEDVKAVGAAAIETDFSFANLYRANFEGSNLEGANFDNAYFVFGRLKTANLHRAVLNSANLRHANFEGACLERADLIFSNLTESRLVGADLSAANLSGATIVSAEMDKSNLTGARVYGSSAWNLKGEDFIQKDLIITPFHEPAPAITVDSLEVAQFVFLLLNNRNIRSVIDTVSRKGVLILGRFVPERKAILDAIRNELRGLGFVPIMFDFERPEQRDFTETIMTLAGLCCFIIADLTNPKSKPLELQALASNYMIPFVPILQDGEEPFSMFKDLQGKFDWILPPLIYKSTDDLLDVLEEAVIKPAMKKLKELKARKDEGLLKRSTEDYRA